MPRPFLLALCLSLPLLALDEASGQEWARKMFATTSHDFGTVARGSKQEFAFQVTNPYKETVHIASVRSSCGCTSPKITRQTLKTRETSEVVAVLNTRSFLGDKGATITVVIDEPFYAEVQLFISSYIRSDVVFSPGVVEFGSVDAGSPAEKTVDVSYAGRSDWEIVDVRSAGTYYEVELQELQRGSGEVRYRMTVRLKPEAPTGYLQDQLYLVTNDARRRNVILPVEGNVVSPMTVSPASLFLGVLKPGEKAKKQLVVRGKTPFKIVEVKCDDAQLQVPGSDTESKTLHFLPVEYTAGETPGNVVRKIEIKTDLPGGLCAECVATATIQAD